MSAKNLVQKAAEKIDGWINVLTSIGVKGKDKRLGADVKWERGTRDYFEHFYSADDVAGNIVDVVPEEAMAKGYELTGVEDPDTLKSIYDRLKAIKLNTNFIEAWRLARMHGGAGLIKVTEDAQMDNPIPLNKKILSLSVADRWDLVVNSTDIDGDITSPNFRNPMQYSLQLSEGSKSLHQTIHAERVVRFDGAFLPRRIMKNNGYWHDSLLTKLGNAIRNYQITNDAVALMIQDFDTPVMKIKDLSEKILSDCDDQIIKRLELVNISKSIAKMVILDADGEEFESKARTVTGLKDLVDKVENRLVTSSRMPRTKLFGESAGGMGGTGESQSTTWYDYLESEQENYAKPKLLEIIRYIIKTEFPSVKPDNVDVVFNPLWQMTAKEESEHKKTVAETDQIYIDKGVLDPSEVSKSRFGSGKYSTETKLNDKLRNTDGDLQSNAELPPLEVKPKTPPADNKAAEEAKAIAQKAAEKADELNALNVEREKEIAELRKQIKANLEQQGVVFSFKKDAKFELERDVKDKFNELLDLAGYKFFGTFVDQHDHTLANFDVVKTDAKGKIRLVVDKSVVNSVSDMYKADSADDKQVYLKLEMRTPAGVLRTIVKSKAQFND